MAQRKRAGLITPRSLDRNELLLSFFFIATSADKSNTELPRHRLGSTCVVFIVKTPGKHHKFLARNSQLNVAFVTFAIAGLKAVELVVGWFI